MTFDFGRSDCNYHDHRKAMAANWATDVPFETVYGPKVKCFSLKRGDAGISVRVIFYFPSGAWWHLDIATKRREPRSRMVRVGGKLG